MDIDLLRLLTSFIVGALLSFSGSLIQITTRNDLASPSTLGMDGLAVLMVMAGFLLKSLGVNLPLSGLAFGLGFISLIFISLIAPYFLKQKDLKIMMQLYLGYIKVDDIANARWVLDTELKNYTTTIDYKYRRQCNFMKIDIDETLDPICMKSSRAGGVFLWGDSHAQALVYGLKHTLPENMPFNMLTTSSCGVAIEPTQFGNKKRNLACNRSNEYIKQHLANLKPKVVILAQRQRHDITDFESIAKFILSQGVEKVILVGQTPQWYPSLPNALLRRHWDNTNRYIEQISFDHSVIDINQQLHDKYQHSESLTYISLIEHFCQKNACMMKLSESNIPLVWDYGHLTNEASLYVTEKVIYPEILAIFEKSIASYLDRKKTGLGHNFSKIESVSQHSVFSNIFLKHCREFQSQGRISHFVPGQIINVYGICSLFQNYFLY